MELRRFAKKAWVTWWVNVLGGGDSSKMYTWPNGIIFHQPTFSLKEGDFPEPQLHSGGPKTRGLGRYNLTRCIPGT